MWLNKTLNAGTKPAPPETGSVTMSAEECVETDSSAKSRSAVVCSPYGYNARLPVGERVFLLPFSDGEIALTRTGNIADLKAGEILISSLGGANIILKNNGDVVINGLIVDREGNIV